ncbi:hypothetical protein IFR05_001452 [Cadophora sp. M221]|nr:hypothetical protein IFR05_001452 [Cadophora sp. M221]
MASFTANVTPEDMQLADTQTNGGVDGSKERESGNSVPLIDLTRNTNTINPKTVLVAGAFTPLEPLSRNVDILAQMPAKIAFQRLLWTPMSKWADLKRLSKHNAGLFVAFQKENAALLCNFVIKTRYRQEAEYLGLDISGPPSNRWLMPTGQQVLSLSNCEQKFWLWAMEELNLDEDEHLYEPSISFLEPGPALLFGLESGMVMIMRDSAGRVTAALREDVARECMVILTKPWFIKPKGYGKPVLPRSESGAITWFYDQEGSREGAVEALNEILEGPVLAETLVPFDFEEDGVMGW